MSSVDDLANAATNSYNLDNQNPEGNDRESEDNLSSASSKEKRKHSSTVTEELTDTTSNSCDKVIEKFKTKEKVFDHLTIHRVFDQCDRDSPIALEEISLRTSDWNEQVLSLLKIKVDQGVYEPHDLFNSGFVKFLIKQHATKISGFIGYTARNVEHQLLLKKCLTLAFTDIVKVDCSEIDEIPLHKVIEMENELNSRKWTQKFLKTLGSFDSKHECAVIDFCQSLRVWMKQFVQQLSWIVQKRKRSMPEEITEGMFQELFILFVKMFKTQITGYPNLSPYLLHLGAQIVSSTPDALIYLSSCRNVGKENAIAVIKINKECRKYETDEGYGEQRTIGKRLKLDQNMSHIPSELKAKHIGEMLALLPSSVFGTRGIYGFLVQGTKVTLASLEADEEYLENLSKGVIPEKDCCGKVKYSEECNILTLEGRLALIPTLLDMTALLHYLCEGKA